MADTPADRAEFERGKQSAENGGARDDNPHRYGSREWFAFEDGRRAGGAEDVGPAPGTPAWA